ncbi:hypothetical protein BKA58DRAFT_181828 [Alternaria rosae]|uniref:uncharacterized protein n=1 Tax=Alternaria rosae TaxID=1187941 RepID=UPI001E8DFA4C|nr:uncharacterized protein BKA58DRAFT_181828 [Alternaria rosae]KAH6870696.1 hypothetical protein BKA58DRAFT_181828 [Alternaria rosae]
MQFISRSCSERLVVAWDLVVLLLMLGLHLPTWCLTSASRAERVADNPGKLQVVIMALALLSLRLVFDCRELVRGRARGHLQDYNCDTPVVRLPQRSLPEKTKHAQSWEPHTSNSS